MHNLRNRWIVVAAMGVLALGSLMNSRPVAAQQGPPDGLAVRIINPIPVPITGSSTVSGTVAATQSGPWSVGINGTPTILTRSLEEPGRMPFQQQQQLATSNCSGGFCSETYLFPKVPADKRLVITDLSVYFTAATGAIVLPVTLCCGGPLVEMNVPIARHATSLVFGAFCTAAKPCDTWVLHERLTYYGEPNSTPGVVIGLDQAHNVPIFKSVTLTGYYVSLP